MAKSRRDDDAADALPLTAAGVFVGSSRGALRRPFAIAVGVLVIALGGGSITPAAAYEASETTSISGTVSLPEDVPGEWVNAVHVSANPMNGAGSGGYSNIDPETGQYTIGGLPPGDYRVQFSASSYWDSAAGQSVPVNLISEYFENTVDYSSATAVTTSPGAQASGIDAALEYGSTISGTVTLPADAPVEWMNAVSVYANRVNGSGSGGYSTINRETGEYTITGLAPGDYRVQFSAYSYWDSAVGKSVPVNLMSEYYDNAVDYNDATFVTTGAGGQVSGIDAALEYGSTISGTISLPGDAPEEWWNAVYVSASPVNGVGSGGSPSIDRATGQYTITGLTAGDYRVQFSAGSYWDADAGQSVPVNLIPEYYDNAADYSSATLVEIAPAAPASGIDAALEYGATISGTLRDIDGAPVEGVGVWVIDADDTSSGFRWGASSDAAGQYSLQLLPAGAYKVFIGNLGGVPAAFRRTFLGGPTFASATKVTVAHGATIAGQDAVLQAVEPNAPRPSAPVLSAGTRDGSYATVTWPTPASADPILAYGISTTGGWWGDGGPLPAPQANSTQAWVGEESALVLLSAYTGSAEGSAGAVAVNDPAAPAAPVLRVAGKTGTSLIVSADSSAPADAEWWFAILPEGAGAAGLIVEYPDEVGGNSFTFENVDPTSEVRVFAGYRSGGSMSQIATLTKAGTPPPAGPTVHPWFAGKYAELGGAAGSLGVPLDVMQCQSSSCWQEFEGGVLTSDGRQIVKLSTAYVETWLTNGGPDGVLGLVAGPEACFGTYCVVPFTHGVIKWTPNVGVAPIVVHAWFEAAWKALGGVTGSIGSPVDVMRCQSSACWQEFTGGVLTSGGKGIVKLSTAYVKTWLDWGGPNGDLGLVAGAESCFGSYCQTAFSGGVIVWVPNSGVFPVAKNWFYPAWVSRGGANGSLGLPTDAMRCQSAACYQVFQKGTLTSSTSSIVALSSAYVSTWLANGGPGGALGLVNGSEACFGTYCQVPFQHGLLVWDPGSGVRVLTGTAWAEWEASHAAPKPGTPSYPGDTKNCTDFATHAQAQAWFDLYYPLYGDVAKLDGNNDRIACESLR